MAANNLVTSGYITMLRAAVEGTPVGNMRGTPGKHAWPGTPTNPMRRKGSSLALSTPVGASGRTPHKSGKATAPSSVSTTATFPGDEPCPATPSSAGYPSTELADVPVNPSCCLEVSLNRFREIGITRKQAHCPQDVLLCWKMCSLMGLEDVPDLFVVMLYRGTKLLHRCGYHTQDIVTMASYAVVYAVDVLAKHLGTMDWKEAANMFGLQLYLAHAYLMDEHCPLKEWHKHIFSQYCSMPVLATATMQLMRSRGFHLALPSQGLQHIYRELLLAVHNYRWNPSILDIEEEGL